MNLNTTRGYHDNDCSSFPGQEKVGGDAKIPSVIYYDSQGDVKAVGGEARNLDDWVLDDSDDETEKWKKCEW